MKIKKNITFIYMDEVEKQIFNPIYEEAKKRGYKVKMTNDKFAKCEMGFYCQHINFPQFSKFSLIMFHDIIQQYSNWPDVWFREPWNKYDIGFLPGKRWIENWNQCSQYFYARPRSGVYEVGWPKADILKTIEVEKVKNEIVKRYNLDLNKRTVLYAPAWENDYKQDDFVKAMLELDVNILIKQYPADLKIFPESYKWIQKMYELHKNNSRVKILDPQFNILLAISLADILVSEESSTMCEAVMMGKPAVSVSDWLIPDTIPSRYPRDDYDFVIKTKKKDLKDCVHKIINNYETYRMDAVKYSENNYGNIGTSAEMIMNVIDTFTDEKSKCNFQPLNCRKNKIHIKRYLKYFLLKYKVEIVHNYCCRFFIMKKMLEVYKLSKNFWVKKTRTRNS